MSGRAARAFLADELQTWVTQGLVPPETAAVLRERWNPPGIGIAAVLKYLGALGGGLTVLGLLGLISTLSGSQSVQGVLCLSVSVAVLWVGRALWADPRGRYAWSARMLLSLGIAGVGGGVWLVVNALAIGDHWALDVTALGTTALAVAVAYRYRIRFALFLGIVFFMSWLGSVATMHGRSTYALEIAQTVLTLVAGALLYAFGEWHARSLDQRFPGFAFAYQVMGLIYANVVLLGFEITSLEHDALWRWVGIFVVSIAQVVLGARLLRPLLTGFGVTLAVVMGIAIYGERCWERLDHGVFFLVGGAVLFALGLAFELRQREVSP